MHQWKAGIKLFQVQEIPEGILLKLLNQKEGSRIEDVAGCFKAKLRVSLADMEATVENEASTRVKLVNSTHLCTAYRGGEL